MLIKARCTESLEDCRHRRQTLTLSFWALEQEAMVKEWQIPFHGGRLA